METYSYSWSGPDNFTSADEDLTGIVAGEYTVEVTDGNGCTVTETFGVPVGVIGVEFLAGCSGESKSEQWIWST
jgi:hypothetical protein